MATDTLEITQPAHRLIDRLAPDQIDAGVRFSWLWFTASPKCELPEDDRQAIAASRVGNHRELFDETENVITIHRIRDRRDAHR